MSTRTANRWIEGKDVGAGLALALVLAVGLMLTGCSLDNGLPKELTGHLAERGIRLVPTRVHAPLSSRGGFVVARHDGSIASNVIAEFKLEKVHPGDGPWQWAVERAGGNLAARELWGVAGRPPQFKLKNGGQFQYFYLLITADGDMYLIAEYAYG